MYTGEKIKSKVYHVGHHGSRNASSQQFLEEVNPEYGIISAGKNNKYKHPHEETLKRLRDVNTKIFRTDESGDILMVSDGKDLIVSTEK